MESLKTLGLAAGFVLGKMASCNFTDKPTAHEPMRKDVAVFILYLVTCAGFIFWHFSTYKLNSDEANQAKAAFEHIKLSNQNPNNQQRYFDAITNQKGWHLISEKVDFAATENSFFPFTANYHAIFRDPNDEHQEYVDTKLFLYDVDHDVWLPVAGDGVRIKGNEAVSSTDTNIWKEGNDWVDQFRQKPGYEVPDAY